jgi:hypothetical protein
MNIENKTALFFGATLAVVLACAAFLPPRQQQTFPGLSSKDVHLIRKAVSDHALPKYWNGFSWDAVRYLPKIVRIHQRWHIDEIVSEGDGRANVRFTMQFSHQTVSNFVYTVRRHGEVWMVIH